MQKLINFVLVVVLIASVSCSDDPAQPQFRVKNDRSTDASLQVKTSAGNTININNVAGGTTSAYQAVAAGLVEITVSIQGEPDDFEATFVAVTDQTFTIVVANTTPPTINVVNP